MNFVSDEDPPFYNTVPDKCTITIDRRVTAGETEVDYLYRIAEPFSSILYKTSPGKPSAMDLIGIFAQPRAETLCDVHCFMLVYDEISADDYLVQWQQSIFLQDRTILENQRPLRLPLAPRAELPIRADAMSTAYRKWLQGHGLTYGVIPAGVIPAD